MTTRRTANATAEDIDRVWVNGRLVVDAGRVVAADERMWPRIAQHDWAGRDADGLSPPTYPEWR